MSTTTADPIRIRTYRPEDFPEVKRLFYEGMAYGPETPAVHSARAVRKSPVSILAYLTSALSIWFIHRTKRIPPRLRILGTLFAGGSILSYLLWIFRTSRKMMVAYCDQCLREDLKDITKHYQLAPVQDGSGDYEPVGAGCFWVAERQSESKNRPEIVGCIGLDNSDGSSVGELRRLSVSRRERKSGIGSRLVQALTTFAQQKGLSSLRLTTSQFQPAALNLYLKRGWEITKTVNFEVDVFPVTFDMHTVEYTLQR
ncbi:hypothetical protein V5O48_002986 [Marasmius crinis-equi]|uniref:N-acetyltransferase domain-containing protein n=1 Tax=Marasmius crinis-equi TaxID=585013 RepID=A0ABR3FUJ3_9AGAR